jgi:hypothetical protein
MNEIHRIDRREFTVEAALAMLSGVLITITGCSDNSPSKPSPIVRGDISGTISNNHGHVATITSAQLTAANALALDIRGSASHSHTVELTATQIKDIAGGTRVAMESTTESGHQHTVTFN